MADSETRPRILLLLPDGVGVRNFLLGPFAREAGSKGDLTALHAIPPEVVDEYRRDLDSNVQWIPLSPFHETPAGAVLRYALSYAQMYWAATKAMRFTLKLASKGSWRTKAMHRAARIAGWSAGYPAGIRTLSRWHSASVGRLADTAAYVELFERIRPDVLFCTHQRPPIILPAVVAARSMGIPTATFIFSWDNLSGKGRIAAPFDHYFVWSDHMRDELRRFYPDVPLERIHVAGTPQFDPYADESQVWTRDEFCARVGADPGRPLICYSGGDPFNSPEDQEHVRILMEHIRSGRVRRTAQVLLRPAPVDDGSRFDAVRAEFPELIFAKPEWLHTGNRGWDKIFPTAADVTFLANLTRHADLNINLGSTMSLDFAIHDRPVINVAFDVASPPPFGTPIWDHHYRFEHYQPVIDLKAVRFARSADEMAAHVEAYLDNPALDREGRRRLVALQLGEPAGSSSRRIVSVLRRIAAAPPEKKADESPLALAMSSSK
jgi:hypothetical protein